MIEKTVLKEASLFGELKSYEWDEILKIAEEKEYKEGDIVFPQGDETTDLYFVAKGEVEIQIKIAPQLSEITVYVVKPYDVFGEFAFVDPKPRSATARCKKDSTLVMIRKENFSELTKKFPKIGVNFYKRLAQLLSEKLRRMNKYLREIFLRSLGLEV